MASTPKAARQSLDIAETNRANQANSRQSTVGGSVQGRLVQPRWNASTKISSPTVTVNQKTETADQKMERFRKREEALLLRKTLSVCVRENSDVSNHSTNPTRRTFSNLPAEIISQILGNLDPLNRLVTRNVSRTLRSIVDSEKPNISRIEVFENPERSGFRFWQTNKDRCKVTWSRKTAMLGDYLNLNLQFLKPILSNPKLKLERFTVAFSKNPVIREIAISPIFRKLFDMMSEVVKSTNTQFHVEHLGIFGCTEEQLDTWLPLFKSAVVHNFEVLVDARRGVVNCFESEKFKVAKSINFIAYGGLEPSLINHFLHFETFQVNLHFFRINNILRLLENLSSSNTFKQCEIKVESFLLNLNAIKDAFKLVNPIEQKGELYFEVCYAQFYFCFSIRCKRFLTIRKKSKEL